MIPGLESGSGQPCSRKKAEDLDVKEGFVFERANPGNKRSVREVATAFWGDDPAIVHPVVPAVSGLTLNGKPHPQMYIMSRQAHFMEVEVDVETGEVIVTNLVCVNDVGHLFIAWSRSATIWRAIMVWGEVRRKKKSFARKPVSMNFDNIGYHIGTMNDYPTSSALLMKVTWAIRPTAPAHREDSGASLSGITAGAIYNATGKWVMDYPTTRTGCLRPSEDLSINCHLDQRRDLKMAYLTKISPFSRNDR